MAKIVRMEKSDGAQPHSVLEMSDGTQQVVYEEIKSNTPAAPEPGEEETGEDL